MLAIRMQRVGRKGLAQYRVIVQESHRQPTSGRVVANLGSFDPHTKAVTLDKEKAEYYLTHGAQPSDRVVRVFESEKVTLPGWVKKTATDKTKTIKHAEKLRRNIPKEEVVEEVAETPAEVVTEVVVEETPAKVAESPAAEVVAPEAEVKPETEEVSEEKPEAEEKESKK